jgi:hypothetical protein
MEEIYFLPQGYFPKHGYPEAQLFHQHLASDALERLYTEAQQENSGVCTPEEFVYFLIGLAEEGDPKLMPFVQELKEEFYDKFEKCQLINEQGRFLAEGYIPKEGECVFNKTPHPIIILDNEHRTIKTYPKSDDPIRLSAETVRADSLPDGTPTSKTVFGEPYGLPPFERGKFYIVSQLIKSAIPERTDLLVPAEVVRDDKGNIMGCKSLGL